MNSTFGPIQGTSSLSVSGSNRPLRKRAACNSCHASKVKCSGERHGCTRCQEHGLQCEYEVSMVGRTSTKRGKRKRQDSSTSKAQFQRQQGSEPTIQRRVQVQPTTLEAPTRQNQSHPEHLQTTHGGSAQQTTINPGTDDEVFGHENMSSHPSLSDENVSLMGASEGLMEEFLMFDYPNDPLALDESFQYEASSTTHSAMDLIQTQPLSISKDLHRYERSARQPTPTPSVSTHQGTIAADRQISTSLDATYASHVEIKHPQQTALSSLMEIISDLEGCVRGDRLLRIDNRLSTSRAAICGLRMVIAKNSFQSSGICLVLIASALDLILENYSCVVGAINGDYEDVDHDVHASEARRMDGVVEMDSPSLMTPSTMTPSSEQSRQPTRTSSLGACSSGSSIPLRMGCYELDEEDQVLLRNHIIRKELRRCIEVARSCVKLSQPSGGGFSSNYNRVRCSLQADTEASVYRLLAALDIRAREEC